jgi:hypothetical protein
MTEVFLLKELVVAGEFKWGVFLSLDEAQRALSRVYASGLSWSDFTFDDETGVNTSVDETRRYAILRVPIGVFLKDYAS